MIGWLHSIDLWLFHFVNGALGNPIFDWLMPFVSDSPWFACVLLFIAIMLICKGGARGRVCVLMLTLALCLGNWLVCDPIKNAVQRLRPFHVVDGANLRIGMGSSFSFPSSHAANWFTAAMVLFVYYRRSAFVMFPLAALVCISRVYNGVHYPSDVLAGAILGSGYTVAVICCVDALWQTMGPRWFPLWKAQLPRLANPAVFPAPADSVNNEKIRDAQWLRLGYVLTAVLLFARLAYLASGKIELSEDEAYQWLWSKHLALSYYSKSPLIAYIQFLGTHFWGDSQFGVRFFSPIIAAILTVLVLRFVGREAGGRTAFLLVVAMCATPLLALGSILLTVDPLSVLFWTAAMIAGWRAAGPNGTTRQWLWTGLWLGLGFLSKYTNLYQLVCWAVFFFLWPPARVHLRQPGPWLALLILALCTLPVVIWNSQHNWITVAHVASDGQFGQKWDRTYVVDFLLMEAGVLNPVFFIGALAAAAGFWRNGRRDPWQLFVFSMGTPWFLMNFVLSFHTHIEGNWIAPAVVPMFCLMAVFWKAHWDSCAKFLKPCLSIGIGVGIFAVVTAHDTQLLGKLIHRHLPAKLDVLRRVRGWKETAAIVGRARDNLAAEGAPAFVICEHYGFTSQISFYLPEAKSRVTTDPDVFYLASPRPDNQFYFWPNYLNRVGQNAIFVREMDRPKFRPDWFSRWWRQENDLYLTNAPPDRNAPPLIQREFESVKDIGIRDIRASGDIVRRIQLFECHHLRASP